MIGRLLSALGADDPEVADEAEDGRVALAALMVRLARVDDEYHPREMAEIEAILAERFGLDPAEARALRLRAGEVEAAAPDTVRFTRAIKEAVPYEARIGVVEALWRVALADGIRADEENGLLRLVTSLLGVEDRDSGLARQRAAARA